MRYLRWVLILAAVFTVGATLLPSWSSTPAVQSGWVSTEWGPLGPSDRDLLYRVRQAGLWEMPVGMEAQSRAVTPQFRTVAAKMAAEHMDLDQQVRDAAAKLAVQLPDDPNTDQQSWMREITGKSGADYDRTAVQRLRAAHGVVLPLITSVRVGTRNKVIRDFADVAATFVKRHIEYLESTGLVDFAALPEPPAPVPSGQPVQAPYLDTHDTRTLVIAALVVVLVTAAAAAVGLSLIRRRRTVRVSTPPERPPPPAHDAPTEPLRRATVERSAARHRRH